MTLFKQIHKTLEAEFGQLPTHGILAGQAVAEAYFQSKRLAIKSRMKDLDWFVEQTAGDIKSDEWSFSAGHVADTCVYMPSNDCDLRISEFVKVGLYTIKTSDVINGGRINRIIVSGIESSDSKAMRVLDGFDLNCAACALDLDNKTVVTHPKFDDFCQSKEIDFISIYTPVSSLLRAFEKHRYIQGSSIDLERLAGISMHTVWARTIDDFSSFQEALVSEPEYYRKGTGMTPQRYNGLAQETKDMLSKYFTFSTFRCDQDFDLLVFMPISEPANITSVRRGSDVKVEVASYSLNAMTTLAGYRNEDLFNNVIRPLRLVRQINNLPHDVLVCLKSLVLKRLLTTDFVNIEALLEELSVKKVDALFTRIPDHDHNSGRVQLASLIAEAYRLIAEEGEKWNQCIDNLLAQEESLVKLICSEDGVTIQPLSFSVLRDMIKGVGEKDFAVALQEYLNQPIKTSKLLLRAKFGLSPTEQGNAGGFNYHVTFPKTVKDVLRLDRGGLASRDVKKLSNVMFFEVVGDEDKTLEIVEFSENIVFGDYGIHYSRYGVKDKFQTGALISPVVREKLVEHAKVRIEQKNVYSRAAMKGTLRSVKKDIVTCWKIITYKLNHSARAKDKERALFQEIVSFNKKKPEWDDIPF